MYGRLYYMPERKGFFFLSLLRKSIILAAEMRQRIATRESTPSTVTVARDSRVGAEVPPDERDRRHHRKGHARAFLNRYIKPPSCPPFYTVFTRRRRRATRSPPGRDGMEWAPTSNLRI